MTSTKLSVAAAQRGTHLEIHVKASEVSVMLFCAKSPKMLAFAATDKTDLWIDFTNSPVLWVGRAAFDLPLASARQVAAAFNLRTDILAFHE